MLLLPGTRLMPMSRCWLVLLLLLSLCPALAAASTSARVQAPHDQDRVTSISGSALEIARSSGSLELLQALEQRVSERSSRTTADRPLPPKDDLRLAQLYCLSSTIRLTSVGVFSPLCEHLPYHATAPPAAR